MRALDILVVEPNAVNQRFAVRLLERQGHRVTAAGHGREALAALARQAFDLVLMDVNMPEMDGLEATASIRRREAERGGHVPIVGMAASALPADRDRCLAAGMDGYLARPFRPDELYAAIAAMARPAGGPAPATPGAAGPRAAAPGVAAPATAPTGAAAPPAAVAAGPAPAAPPGDLARALERVGGNAALLAELAGIFLDERAKRMAALETAIRRGDPQQTARAAHTLKSSLAVLGCVSGSSLAAELERLGRERRLDGAPAAFATLAAEVDRLAALLATARRAAPAAP